MTFTAARPAHVFSALTRGPTLVAEIGSPPEAIVSSLQLNVITAHDFASLIGPRPADSNKGNYGHVLVVGGSVGKAGSVAMAGMAALRAGAGLSTVATPKSVLPTVAGFHPELMTEPLRETRWGYDCQRARKRDWMFLRKGRACWRLGREFRAISETAELVRTLVGKSDVPIVLDADGLNAFEGVTDELSGKGRLLVITPHPGEMARLAGCSTADVQKDRLGVARKFAREHEVIVVLKGHRTLVVQPNGESLGQHDRESWNVDWRNRRHSHRDGGGNDRAESQGRDVGSLRGGASAWSGGGRDARARGRAFAGCDRSAALGCPRLSNELGEQRGKSVWNGMVNGSPSG